jgi:ribosomal biogenesis protein LAS1
LHDASARLSSVPEWLVELRHETTHGQMPGLTLLRAAVQFGLVWLDSHYWLGDRLGDREDV